MRFVEPGVTIIGRTMADDDMICEYLNRLGAGDYAEEHHAFDEAHDLVEFAGRACYRSWQPGLNPNVTKVRSDQADYLRNILSSRHGSVLEHVSWTFLLEDISRVVTHELVRHRAGTAISQESMRYVRMDDIPMWFPQWAREDDELMAILLDYMKVSEQLQEFLTERFGLDKEGRTFATKKAMTSFIRRFAPGGHATTMVWTANARALRHIIETRTAPGAEEEIRLVFDQVATLMQQQSPLLFGDFKRQDSGSWTPGWSKV